MNETAKTVKGTNKKLRNSRKLKAGWFAALMVVIVLVIVIGVNVLVGLIPATYTNFDTTEQGLFTIGDQTKQIAGSLEEDVTLYHIAQTSSEDIGITELLARYAALSEHIKVQQVDPTDNPTFVSSYTDAALTDNSVLVVSDKRAKGIDYYSIYVTEYSSDYYYSQDSISDQYFDGENQLTAAIDYVTSDELPVVYMLTGHGEYALSESLTKLVEDENFTVSDLSLLSAGAVPDDASCVIVLSPSSDLSADEVTMLNDYIDRGGSILMYTDYLDEPLPNLAAWTQSYGAIYENGIVCESDSTSFYQYSYYVLPKLNAHDITQPLIDSAYLAFMPAAHAISATDEQPDGVTMDVLLYTSPTAYLKENITEETGMEKADGDRSGQFLTGVVMHKGEGQITWFSSSAMLSDNVDQMVSGANSDLFVNSLGYLADREQSISIHSKSLMTERFVVPAGSANVLFVVLVIVIPVGAFAAGLFVWLKRRKK